MIDIPVPRKGESRRGWYDRAEQELVDIFPDINEKGVYMLEAWTEHAKKMRRRKRRLRMYFSNHRSGGGGAVEEGPGGGEVGIISITQNPVPGDTLTIMVTDPDINVDDDNVENVNVNIVNNTTAESEVVQLTETGISTGVFSGTLATSDSAGAGTDDDGDMNVQGSDVITATYNDESPDASIEATSTVLHSPEIITGYTDINWSNGQISGGTINIPANTKQLWLIIGSIDSQRHKVTTFSIDGNSMTLVREQNVSSPGVIQVWKLSNPPTGDNLDIVCTVDGGVNQAFAQGLALFKEYIESAESSSDDTSGSLASYTLSITPNNSDSFVLTGILAEDDEEATAAISGATVVQFPGQHTQVGADYRVDAAYTTKIGAAVEHDIVWDLTAGGLDVAYAGGVAIELVPV